MTKPKGGRGKKAPYETQQMRVPVPIKNQVNNLITQFRDGTLTEVETDDSILVVSAEQFLELETLKDEIQNLKTALAVSKTDNLNLQTALQDTNRQIDNLSSALMTAQSEIQNLSTGLKVSKTDDKNLNTGKGFKVGDEIGEGEALKHFDLARKTLRSPREKGEKKVRFQTTDESITLEYMGQPAGKGKSHLWKIINIETRQLGLFE